MTDEPTPIQRPRPRPRPRRRRSLRHTTRKVAVLSTAGALLVSGFLSLQMAAGKDPVLAPKRQTAAARRTVERHAVKRTVVVHKVQGLAGEQGSGSAPAAAPPVVVAPPVQAAPPAPVVTRAS